MAVIASRVVVGTLAGLLAWAQLPAALPDWGTVVVMSGSMKPALRPGDVVAYRPLDGHLPNPRQVVVVSDPAEPTRLLIHRVRQVLPNHDLVIQGDANPLPDSTPVQSSALKGLARLRIPWVGLPLQLWRTHHVLPLVLFLSGLATVLTLAGRPLPPIPGVATHPVLPDK